ncbi:MAG: type II toxin-antitoxin system Phd/YefM family antitoxin [Pseudomonadota bacterium]
MKGSEGGRPIHKAVTVTQFRRHLAHYIAAVRYGDDYVCIQRRGRDPVYLISQADMDLIWDRCADLEHGPRDAQGHRRGFGLLYWLRRLIKAELSGDPRQMAEVQDGMAANRFGGARRDGGVR